MTPAKLATMLVFVGAMAPALAAAPYARCKECSIDQIKMAAAVHLPKRSISSYCLLDAACVKEAIADGENPARIIYVIDIDSRPVRLWSVRADNQQVQAVPPAQREPRFEVAMAYLDYFASRRKQPGTEVIDLGVDFPVRRAASLVGYQPAVNKIALVLETAIDAARPIRSLQPERVNRALLEVIDQEIVMKPVLFRVRFPDQSLAMIAMTALPTIGFGGYLWQAKLVPGSLRGADGTVLSDLEISPD